LIPNEYLVVILLSFLEAIVLITLLLLFTISLNRLLSSSKNPFFKFTFVLYISDSMNS